MLNQDDKDHLMRALHSNKVMLFLGAGFSCEATNIDGSKIPTGKKLSKLLWNYLYGNDDYDGSDLQILFEVHCKSIVHEVAEGTVVKFDREDTKLQRDLKEQLSL